MINIFLKLLFIIITAVLVVAGTAVNDLLKKPEASRCYNDSGPVSCVGTNQDGELQKGLEVSYIDNSDGTISDTVNGLMWQKCTTGQNPITCRGSADSFVTGNDNGNSSAVSYCENLSLGGHTDWYLPNANQLTSIKANSGVVSSVKPVFANAQSGLYWSTTSREVDGRTYWFVYSSEVYAPPQNPVSILYFYVSSLFKLLFMNHDVPDKYFVRCVR